MAIVTFCRTIHHDGKGKHVHPLSLFLPLRTKLWCMHAPAERAGTLPLSLLYPYMYSVVASPAVLAAREGGGWKPVQRWDLERGFLIFILQGELSPPPPRIHLRPVPIFAFSSHIYLQMRISANTVSGQRPSLPNTEYSFIQHFNQAWEVGWVTGREAGLLGGRLGYWEGGWVTGMEAGLLGGRLGNW